MHPIALFWLSTLAFASDPDAKSDPVGTDETQRGEEPPPVEEDAPVDGDAPVEEAAAVQEAPLDEIPLTSSPREDTAPGTEPEEPSEAPEQNPAQGEPPLEPASESAPSPPEPDASLGDASFEEFLNEAKQRYFRGDRHGALMLLQSLHRRLQSGEYVDWPIATEASFYLGEVYYKLELADEAREVFRWLIDQDSDVQISPYHHPIDVRGLFYEVKSIAMSEAGTPLAPPLAPIAPAPLWTYAPFGAPQFGQGRPVAGLAYGSLQVGLGAASLVLWERLRRDNVLPVQGEPHPLGVPDDQVRSVINRNRFAVQWPVTAAFYGLWAVSVVDGRVAWRRDQRSQAATTVTIAPTEGNGGALMWTGRL